ncbi:hypothetical protein AVEN_243750-1 [Araneus ventricosus]|uniref:Uncharacterized protein n=1 Tax=Araneus ventricosus TaxID=182803 RepID=A0A4Y2A7N0_ARAVE|nr:hypothetical protein AVEN_243750-1 [Araneus ventricosus]
MTGSCQALTPDLGDKLGNKFGDLGDKSKLPENAIIFSISPLVRPGKKSASWKAGEMRAIESAVNVIICESLSVCVARSGSAVTVIASDLCLFVLLICISAIFPVTCFVFPKYL